MHTTTPSARTAWSDTELPCMGSTARLLILGGPPDLPQRARERLAELEAQWTRFQPTSELCRLNAADGAPVLVLRETFDIIALRPSRSGAPPAAGSTRPCSRRWKTGLRPWLRHDHRRHRQARARGRGG